LSLLKSEEPSFVPKLNAFLAIEVSDYSVGKAEVILWPGCSFQLGESGKVIRTWELIKYTLEIALKLPPS
jgi:hypothetical protein